MKVTACQLCDYCRHPMDLPVGSAWLAEVKHYEHTLFAKRV